MNLNVWSQLVMLSAEVMGLFFLEDAVLLEEVRHWAWWALRACTISCYCSFSLCASYIYRKMKSTCFLFGSFLTIIVYPYKTLSPNKPFLHQVVIVRVSYQSNREGANTQRP